MPKVIGKETAVSREVLLSPPESGFFTLRVSWFKNDFQGVWNIIPKGEISVLEALERIRTGESREQVERVRQSTDKNLRDKEKFWLPAITFTGNFLPIRANKNLNQSSGLICLDWDHVLDPQFIKRYLFDNYPECLAAWISPSGNGAKALFRIPLVKNDAEFKLYYASLNLELPDIDDACKDISRLCFESYDPEMLIREWEKTSVWELSIIEIDAIPPSTSEKALQTASRMVLEAKDGQKHHSLIKASCLLGGYITGGSLLEQTAVDHLETEIQKRNIVSFPQAQRTIKDGIRYGKMFPIIIAPEKADKSLPIYQVESFITANYNLRRNIMTGSLENVSVISSEINEDDIYCEIMRNKIKFTQANLTSLLNSSFIRPYDPIRSYFESLSYDGVNDYIGRLAGFVEVSGDPTFFQQMFKKAIVRTVAQGLGEHINRIVFVFKSIEQETGKSTFIRNLNPFKNERYFTEAPIDASNKDCRLALCENLIWNIEELSSLHKEDVNKLKAFISLGDVNERIPYGRRATTRKRRCSFFASTNKDEFLVDERNTRWIIFDIIEINFNYCNSQTGVKLVNINDVWAQAYYLYKSGYNFNLTKDESIRRDNYNLTFQIETNEINLIRMYFTPMTAQDKSAIFLNATDILNYLGSIVNHQVKLSTVGIGKALAQLKYERITVRDKLTIKHGYYVEAVNGDYEQVIEVIAHKYSKTNGRY